MCVCYVENGVARMTHVGILRQSSVCKIAVKFLMRSRK